MTPKAKAFHLYFKYMSEVIADNDKAKQCALIAVDEIDLLLQNSTPKDDPYANLSSLEYWQEVKQEIELL
jgi:hypothetical protein